MSPHISNLNLSHHVVWDRTLDNNNLESFEAYFKNVAQMYVLPSNALFYLLKNNTPIISFIYSQSTLDELADGVPADLGAVPTPPEPVRRKRRSSRVSVTSLLISHGVIDCTQALGRQQHSSSGESARRGERHEAVSGMHASAGVLFAIFMRQPFVY